MWKECAMWWAAFAGILVFGIYGMCIFGRTKTEGFGPYNTSTLLILVIIIISAVLLISGALESAAVENILLTALGFAGGLFAANKSSATPKK